MSDACRHGNQHSHHQHHHIGVAEGLSPTYLKKLKWVMFLALLYFAIQTVGGFYSGSLALWADAGHKLADIGALGLALFAAWFSHLAASPRKTFGYYRLEILAALINSTALVFVVGLILWEAWQRLLHPASVEIAGGVMLGVSVAGLIINLISARLLFPARELSLNVKGALFHLMTDIVNSLGEMATAAGILFFRWYWLDTLVSVVIALLVLYNAGKLWMAAVNILMEAMPARLSPGEIRTHLLDQPGVADVHDLHVWTITTGKDALLAHVRASEAAFDFRLAQTLEASLRQRFDLCHITLQLEPPGFEEGAIPF